MLRALARTALPVEVMPVVGELYLQAANQLKVLQVWEIN